MNTSGRTGYKNALLLLFLILFVISCINPPYPRDLILQHIPTVLFIGALVFTDRFLRFSRLSYTLILGFMTLHLVGARYLYSNVPYDRWANWLFGSTVSETFGLQRNHYDRLVHLGFGLLMAQPAREVQLRYLRVPRSWSYFTAVECIVATSAIYELAEWFVAITLAPDCADRYIGQQGDIWDGQKDMALAATGAIVSMALAALWQWRRRSGTAT